MSATPTIYFDYAAATPVDERVRAAMEPYLGEQFYNPSAMYAAAQKVRSDFEAARASLAQWLGVKAAELVLTSGATESANLAVHGVMQLFPKARVAVSSIEHVSVIRAAAIYGCDLIPVDAHGLVSPDALRTQLRDDTVLVSVGYVNSEIGTVQPIRRLANIIKEVRAEREAAGNDLPLYFHTDASQASAYNDLQVSRLGVDLMTLSAAKIYGPKQVGLLYAKANTRLQPVLYGGNQERGRRAGTENVAGVIGFATALALVREERKGRAETVLALRDDLEEQLIALGSMVQTTVPAKQRAPHILHLRFAGVDAERLLLMLDERGVMVATGAACAANQQTLSHVLKAIGLSDEAAQGSIRCSLSHLTSRKEVEQAGHIFASCLHELQQGRHRGA